MIIKTQMFSYLNITILKLSDYNSFLFSIKLETIQKKMTINLTNLVTVYKNNQMMLLKNDFCNKKNLLTR